MFLIFIISLAILASSSPGYSLPVVPKFGSGHWANQDLVNRKTSQRNLASNHPVSKYDVFDFISNLWREKHSRQKRQIHDGNPAVVTYQNLTLQLKIY